MKGFVVFIGTVFLFAISSAFGEQCRVMDPELENNYVGGCSAGLANGYGTAKGTSVYQGYFKKGKKHGQGIKIWANGDRYIGSFKNDMKDGVGSYRWGEKSEWPGDFYAGEYRNDKHHGQGVYEWANGDRFEGIWKDNLRYGPSAMEIQKKRAQVALMAAVGKPGAIVCLALPHKPDLTGSIRGTVERVVGDRVEVRILKSAEHSLPGEDTFVRTGQIISRTMSDWHPCF